MTMPPLVNPTAPGAQALQSEGWYLLVIQSGALAGGAVPTINVKGRNGWTRAIKLPHPVVGVWGWDAATLADPTGGSLRVGLVSPYIPAAPPGGIGNHEGGILRGTQGLALWLQFWSEAGGWVESDGQIGAVQFVGPGAPGPIQFGTCYDETINGPV